MTLLSVEGLGVNYLSRGRVVRAVHGLSFELSRGETLGLVGESGSGKSTAGRAIMRLLPRNGSIAGGTIKLDGQELTTMSERDLQSLRWNRVSMVFQGAGNVLDPVYTVGVQIAEAIRRHRPGTRRRVALQMADELLSVVGIHPARSRAYPHELSGGMKQRVNIAMAMALNPDLIIADEPTTALDVLTQDGVMAQLLRMRQQHESALLLISHDMGLIAENCDRIGVMYAGRLVEMGDVADVFDRPAHPYTMGLVKAIPRMDRTDRLVALPGFPPRADERPPGCVFEPRCPFSEQVCREQPPWAEVGRGHGSLCHFAESSSTLRLQAQHQETWDLKRVHVGSSGGGS